MKVLIVDADSTNLKLFSYRLKALAAVTPIEACDPLLALRKAQLQPASRAEWLADEVRKATREIAAREREALHHLSRASECRDPETGAHCGNWPPRSRPILACWKNMNMPPRMN